MFVAEKLFYANIFHWHLGCYGWRVEFLLKPDGPMIYGISARWQKSAAWNIFSAEEFQDGFCSRANMELVVDVLEMSVDGIGTDGETAGDFLGRVPLGEFL